jgi:hypothetical protein
VISTPLSGSPIACELPDLVTLVSEVPQTSSDFRFDGPVPETLADLLPSVDKESRTRWGMTFKLLIAWLGPAETILLKNLFMRLTMAGFRPFLRERGKVGYAENTIVHHRKGLHYLRNLAASHGVQVEPEYKPAWLRVMALAKEAYCLFMAEHFEALYDTPADVTLEDVKNLTHKLINTKQKRMSSARKEKCKFLFVLRKCGFIKNQPTAAGRDEDLGATLQEMPEPMQTEVKGLHEWSMKDGDSEGWSMDWDLIDPKGQQTFLALRKVTADQVVKTLCRAYGYVLKVVKKPEGIVSLETLLQSKIFRSYANYLIHVRKQTGGSLRTQFGTLFSTLRHFRGAPNVNLAWTSDFIKSLPVTTREERVTKQALRAVPFESLEKIPDQLHQDLNSLVKRNKRAEEANNKRKNRDIQNSAYVKFAKERTTRLIRIGVKAQQEVIVKYLTKLAWRGENLIELRVDVNSLLGKGLSKVMEGALPPNLFKGPVMQVPGMDIPKWAEKELKEDPNKELLQVQFSANETKAGRSFKAVVPKVLIDMTENFVKYYRPLLLVGLPDPGTLFVNQVGGPMTSQQLEETVEETTLLFTNQSVYPHLFRHIFAFAYLKANNWDYIKLSRILWHINPEVTISTYAWMFNESVGTNFAGEWSDDRDAERSLIKTGVKVTRPKSQAVVAASHLPHPNSRLLFRRMD